jgi:hypothetical protein
MKPTERVTLNMRELERIKVIQSAVDGSLQPRHGAERSSLTATQQVRRLVACLREQGQQPDKSCHRISLVRRPARTPGAANHAVALFLRKYQG